MSLTIHLSDNICSHCRRWDPVWSKNITHNLTTMARAAGIYYHLWRPDELDPPIDTAKDIVEPLKKGLDRLISDPIGFSKFNPENGWGTYGGLVGFVGEYITAAEKYPEAKIEICR